MKDKLTQLYTRETFFNILDEQIVSAHKKKSQLALLIIDHRYVFRLFSALMSEILSKIEHALLIRNGGLPDF